MLRQTCRTRIHSLLCLLVLVGLVVTYAALAPAQRTAAMAQTTGGPPAGADPSLVKIYNDIVRREMPGVPFSILEGAKKERQVVWYHIRLPAAHEAVLKAFSERFPFVAVETFEAVGPPLMERFLTEQRAGSRRVDVLQSTDVLLMKRAIDEGFIDTYKVTSERAFRPGSYQSGVYYTYVVATQVVYIYNTNLINEKEAQLLRKWEGLWDPAFRGKPIGVLNASGNSAGQLQFYFLEKKYGKQSWQKIKELNPRIYEPLPGGDAVARGEVAVIPNSESVALNMWLKKAPIRWTAPEPSLARDYPQAVVKGAPHPNAARLFHEFVMSKAGQELFAKYAYPSARQDVGDLRDVTKEAWFPKDRAYHDLDLADIGKQTPRIVEEWRAMFLQ